MDVYATRLLVYSYDPSLVFLLPEAFGTLKMPTRLGPVERIREKGLPFLHNSGPLSELALQVSGRLRGTVGIFRKRTHFIIFLDLIPQRSTKGRGGMG